VEEQQRGYAGCKRVGSGKDPTRQHETRMSMPVSRSREQRQAADTVDALS
jgi:hypothetical protein